MRVAEPFLEAYGIGCHDALAVIHGGKIVAVIAQRVIDVFVIVRRKIGEKVVAVGLKTVDGNLVRYNLCFFAHVVVHGCRERDFLVFADKSAVNMAFVGEEERIAAFPGDGEGFSANFYGVGEGKVGIQVVYDVAQAHAIDRDPERG